MQSNHQTNVEPQIRTDQEPAQEPFIEHLEEPDPYPIEEQQINLAQEPLAGYYVQDNAQQKLKQLQLLIQQEIPKGPELQPDNDMNHERQPHQQPFHQPKMVQTQHPLKKKLIEIQIFLLKSLSIFFSVIREIVSDIAPRSRISRVLDFFRGISPLQRVFIQAFFIAIFIITMIGVDKQATSQKEEKERIVNPKIYNSFKNQEKLSATTSNVSVDTWSNFTHQPFEALPQMIDTSDLFLSTNKSQIQKKEEKNRNHDNFTKQNSPDTFVNPSKINEDPKIPNSSPYGQLIEKDTNFFINQVIEKYITKHQEIKKMEEKALEENSFAIHQLKQLTAKPIGQKYNREGKLIQDYESSPIGILTLELFPITNVKHTSPYAFPHFHQHFLLSFLPMFYSIDKGWQKLREMLRGDGMWESNGALLTVGSHSYGLEDGQSDFNLFVPTIFTFQFPWNIPEDSEVAIYGIRVNYDLYLKKQSFVLQECLGRFQVKVTEQERRCMQPIKRLYYCDNLKCNSLFSLIKVVSKYQISLHSFRIDSVLSMR